MLERTENIGILIQVNPYPCIADSKVQRASIILQLSGNRHGDGTIARKFGCIGEQVQQNLLDRSIKATAAEAAPVLRAEKERAERRAPGTNGFGMWN